MYLFIHKRKRKQETRKKEGKEKKALTSIHSQKSPAGWDHRDSQSHLEKLKKGEEG